MTETIAVLVFAHVLADFVFQTNGMVARKRNPLILLLHGGIVLVTAGVALGSVHPALLLLAVLHLALDAAKTWTGLTGLGAYLGDQALHLVTILAIAIWQPDLWANGLWMGGGAEGGLLSGVFGGDDPVATPVPSLMALIAGFILATRAGGFAVGFLMAPWTEEMKTDVDAGLAGGGRLIGLLERGLIFLLILTGQAQSIGFLIAAKSVLRFSAITNDRRFSEYVIIGTLASFAWAIAVAALTVIALDWLPELVIPDLAS